MGFAVNGQENEPVCVGSRRDRLPPESHHRGRVEPALGFDGSKCRSQAVV